MQAPKVGSVRDWQVRVFRPHFCGSLAIKPPDSCSQMSRRAGEARRSTLTPTLVFLPAGLLALAYAAGSQAPTVVAKGRGLVAEQIIERARDAGVFVHESKELVQLLMGVDLDREIPPALYRAIAELLAWLYHIESAKKNGLPLPAAPDPTPHLPQGSAAEDVTQDAAAGAANTEE